MKEKVKKILIIDDSALMRRAFCDIINSDERFEVADCASNGLDALELLKTKSYDAVLLDIVMPKLDGLGLLRELRRLKIAAKVMMVSTHTEEGAKVTMEALSLGALDFVKKPDSHSDVNLASFREKLLSTLDVVANSHIPMSEPLPVIPARSTTIAEGVKDTKAAKTVGVPAGDKIVAIASSTGGPRALQTFLPQLPANLDAPVLLVQHMPKGFTESLADRLNSLSNVRVKEAEEGEELRKGTVYMAMGGKHMTLKRMGAGRHVIHYTDEPIREGVKPCANYMYESLVDSDFKQIACVVMTGMGADGTEGIRFLKKNKSIRVFVQNEESCAVYGMPKSVVKAGLSDKEMPLVQIAQEIIQCVGVQNG